MLSTHFHVHRKSSLCFLAIFSMSMRLLKKNLIKSRSIKALVELMIAILNIYFYAREKYGLFLTHFINLEMRNKR